MEVKRTILSALSQFPVDVSEEIVTELESRIRSKYTPDRQSSIVNFAYTVARNWAVDSMRKKVTAARRTAAQMIRVEQDRTEQQRYDRCRVEFEAIVRMIFPTLHHTQQTQINMVRMTCFEQKSHEECGLIIPSTRHQQIQWKSRGIRLVHPHASEELADFLKKRAKYLR